ncbi:hypothetical protein PGTUg99_019617 [Puccinia graminis f. sp. tritici]|uniref:Uncharacterized protein n=1 Tax=Puccinia graminis f. sp. tritici TaxID=56615 RepID=A0A5B0NJE9_PUCGR|nr:hypothetical protein PGTUg99_019617 [Puccinia graminis f. sp. tritici]
MSLTPPPPPPPPHRPSGLAPSGCKTPRLNTATRRLSTASSSSTSNLSPSAPSPNQLRQILADITKQVNNSPQSRLSTTTTATSSSNAPRPSPIRSHHPAINGFMRPSLRETGPVTRSRSMLHLITPRSSLTPRATRANTPVRDENHSPLHPPTPRTPFTTTNNNSPSSSSRSHLRSPPSNENQASGSSSSSSSSSSHGNRTPGHPIAPLRYRTLSSVSSSLTNPTSSPSGRSVTSENRSRAGGPPTPSHPSLRLRPHSSNPPSSAASTPPLTPASSLTSSTATSDSSSNELASHAGLSTPRERRSLDQVDSPSASFDQKPSPAGSIAKLK